MVIGPLIQSDSVCRSTPRFSCELSLARTILVPAQPGNFSLRHLAHDFSSSPSRQPRIRRVAEKCRTVSFAMRTHLPGAYTLLRHMRWLLTPSSDQMGSKHSGTRHLVEIAFPYPGLGKPACSQLIDRCQKRRANEISFKCQ